MPELLIELFSEEIPARMQQKAADDLRQMVTNALVESGLTYEGAQGHGGARRLVLSVEASTPMAADVNEERKGPRTDAPSRRSTASSSPRASASTSCTCRTTRKGQFYIARIRKPAAPRPTSSRMWSRTPSASSPGPSPCAGAPAACAGCARSIPSSAPSTARWLPFEIEGIKSGNVTRGHRFMGAQHIEVRRFEDYAQSSRRNSSSSMRTRAPKRFAPKARKPRLRAGPRADRG